MKKLEKWKNTKSKVKLLPTFQHKIENLIENYKWKERNDKTIQNTNLMTDHVK